MISSHKKNVTLPRGRLITLEGGEGVGKSTQIQKLAHYLKSLEIPCLTTRQPGGTPLGQNLRQLIFHPDWDPIEEMFLILADRRYHWRHCIAPALEKGIWVLCDRYIDSSLVYQGLSMDVDFLEKNLGKQAQAMDPQIPGLSFAQQWIVALHQRVGLDTWPDLTILLRDFPQRALARRQAQPKSCNKFDYAHLQYHESIARAYEKLAKCFSRRYVVSPIGRRKQGVTAWMLQVLRQRFPKIIKT